MPSTLETVEKALALVRAYDIAYADCFADDAVAQYPFAPPGFPREIRGRAAMRALLEPRYRTNREAGRSLEYRNFRAHLTADAEVVVVEFDAVRHEPDGSTAPSLSFAQVIRVRNGEIVELRDYFDSLAMVSRL
jgi:ketosteroid isomerase-like protein